MNKGSSLPGRENRYRVSGQSIVEAVVVLALVAILVITLLRGVGQQTASRLQLANEALEDAGLGNAPGGNGAGDNSGQGGAGGSGSGAPVGGSGGAHGGSSGSGGGGLPVGTDSGGGLLEPAP